MKKIVFLLMLFISLAGYAQRPMFVEVFSNQQDSTLNKLYSICRNDSAILVVNHFNDSLMSVFYTYRAKDVFPQLSSFCIPSYVVGGYVIPDSLGTDWKAYNDMNNRYLTNVTNIKASLTTLTFGGDYKLGLNLSNYSPDWKYSIFIVEDFDLIKCVQRSYIQLPANGPINVSIEWRNNWVMDNCRLVVEIENANRHTIGIREMKIQDTFNTGIENVSMPQISIYPNPCTDIINIQSDQPLSNMKILNDAGQILYFNKTINDYTIQYSTADLPKGLYFVQLSSKTFRFIKQ